MFELNKKYSTVEFVAELGISKTTWTNHKDIREKYLDYARDFINFTIEKKGRQNFYIVHDIYQEYEKPDFRKLSKLREEVRSCFKDIWQVNAPETCSRVAAKMIKQNLVSSVSQGSVERVVGEVRNEYYGKPSKCHYVRAKMYRNCDNKDKSLYTYELLDAADKEILCKVHRKWYPNDDEKIDILREKLNSNEINTVDEVANIILEQDLTQDERNNKFLSYTGELAHELSCDWIVRATYVEDQLVAVPEDIEAMEEYYAKANL